MVLRVVRRICYCKRIDCSGFVVLRVVRGFGGGLLMWIMASDFKIRSECECENFCNATTTV